MSALLASPAAALDVPDLEARGYQRLTCEFHERCLIGQPCERAWRYLTWHVLVAEESGFREMDNGRLRRVEVRQDARWGDLSDGLSILSPMREAVASHLTMFDGGGAIYAIQYAANPGSGQFLLGHCNLAPARSDEDME
ncbi:MAG: hypothetical protein AAGF79_09715 [Pseudomonadota bacterium]